MGMRRKRRKVISMEDYYMNKCDRKCRECEFLSHLIGNYKYCRLFGLTLQL
ncbi:MAG: hypothetical protein JRC86_01515 [Deltaproteobacteria bacterium]|nr:hypothetical protein [Deltaproteobacteria bacterium]